MAAIDEGGFWLGEGSHAGMAAFDRGQGRTEIGGFGLGEPVGRWVRVRQFGFCGPGRSTSCRGMGLGDRISLAAFGDLRFLSLPEA